MSRSALPLLVAILSSVPARRSFGQPEDEIRLGISYSTKTLTDVNPQDARAASKVYSELIARRRGFPVVTESYIFEDLGRLKAAIQDGRLQQVLLLGHEYLQLGLDAPIDPAFASYRDGSVYEQLYILARSDSKRPSLSHRRGVELMVSVSQGNDIPEIWLDTMLLRRNLPG